MIRLNDVSSSRTSSSVYVDPTQIAALISTWTDKSDYGVRIYELTIYLKSGVELSLHAKSTDIDNLQKAINK